MPRSLFLICLLLTPVSASDTLMLVQPGYPGSTEDAKAFVQRLIFEVTRQGGPSFQDGAYHNNEEEGVVAIEKNEPSTAVVSLGFFLEYQERFSLDAVLWSEPQEPFRVLVRKGTIAKLSDLEGRTITGTPLVEAEFVDRVLFDPPKEGRSPSWEPKPTKLFSRAIRRVQKGRADAVILNAREFRGFQRLRSSQDLQVIHTTGRYPAAVVVILDGRVTGAARASLTKALENLRETEPGKELLEEMGIGNFRAVDPARLSKWADRYRSPPATRSTPARPR